MEKINAQVFLKIVETGSFKAAADALGYTQAGVSYIAGTMEEELGFKAFTREYGGVKLTAEGREILPLIHQIDNGHRALEAKSNEINNLETGFIRFVTFESIFIHWIPGILEAFCRDYPNVEFDLVSQESREVAEKMVYTRDADCGIFVTPVKENLETIQLVNEPMMAIVSPEHPLAKEEKFPVEKLSEYPYIAMRYEESSEVGDIFRKFNASLNISFRADSDYAVMAMVSKNLGYGIFSKTALENTPFPLHVMEFSKPVNRTIGIGVRSLDGSSKIVRKFIEYVRSWVAGHYAKEKNWY